MARTGSERSARALRPLSTTMIVLSAVLAFLISPLAALAGDPEVTITRFENLPNRLFYFDDTPVRSPSLSSFSR